MQGPIYLDYNATTPVDPRVVEVMLPYLSERFGNASSTHAYGRTAHAAMERARGQVASLIGADADEIVFTGGGTESDNLAIKGVVSRHLDRHPHVVTTAVDHSAVVNVLRYLQRRFRVEYTAVDVDDTCLVSVEDVRAALRPETVLVTIMLANNEVGTIQPIAQIAELVHASSALLHVDAAQAVGKIPVQARDLGADILTVAGHKLYAPKGIGALYIRRGSVLDPLVHGSGQEHGFRSGTENVASIVALGAACEIAQEQLADETVRLECLRDVLHERLAQSIPGTTLNGHPTKRLPNTLNVSLPGVSGQEVLACTPGVAASTGSACHSGRTEPSDVLVAMGLSEERAQAAIRLSLGRWSTQEEIERAAQLLSDGYGSVHEATRGRSSVG